MKKHQIRSANVIIRNVRVFQAKQLSNLKREFPIVSQNVSVIYNQFANQNTFRNRTKIRNVLTASEYRDKLKLKASKVVFRYILLLNTCITILNIDTY